MRVEWAIPCRYCEVTGNEVVIIGGNASAFTVPELPAEIGVWIALQIAAPAHETGPGVPHSLRGRVLDPQMQEIPDAKLDIESFEMDEPALPGWEADQVVPTYHFFAAETTGTYTIELTVDERTKSVPITVFVPAEESADE